MVYLFLLSKVIYENPQVFLFLIVHGSVKMRYVNVFATFSELGAKELREHG